MKLWLASFPRSGNTFARAILLHVYGIKSTAFALSHTDERFKDYAESDIVKTHECFEDLKDEEKSHAKVYIVRDGRDCVVSMAHQQADLLGENSKSFNRRMLEVITAPKHVHFGGWSRNVKSWIDRADVIIKFEDLIVDPIGQIERIRAVYDLPEPDRSKLPSFDDMKAGKSGFAKRKNDPEFAQKFFRRGKAGAWQDEMPWFVQQVYWYYHGSTMKKLGYPKKGLVSHSKTTTKQ